MSQEIKKIILRYYYRSKELDVIIDNKIIQTFNCNGSMAIQLIEMFETMGYKDIKKEKYEARWK